VNLCWRDDEGDADEIGAIRERTADERTGSFDGEGKEWCKCLRAEVVEATFGACRRSKRGDEEGVERMSSSWDLVIRLSLR
jgi:hypothetical protein